MKVINNIMRGLMLMLVNRLSIVILLDYISKTDKF